MVDVFMSTNNAGSGARVSGSNTGFLEWDELHRPSILNNARNELKIGVLRVLLVFSKSTMMKKDISIISV